MRDNLTVLQETGSIGRDHVDGMYGRSTSGPLSRLTASYRSGNCTNSPVFPPTGGPDGSSYGHRRPLLSRVALPLYRLRAALYLSRVQSI